MELSLQPPKSVKSHEIKLTSLKSVKSHGIKLTAPSISENII